MGRLIHLLTFAGVCLSALSSPQHYDPYYQQYQHPLENTHLQPTSANVDYRIQTSDEKAEKIGDLLFTIKGQIKEAIKEVITQIVEKLKAFVYSLKVKFFKKMGKVTISDVFKSIFGGVSEFVQDTQPASHSYDSFNQPTKDTYVRPTSVFEGQNW